MPPPEPTPAEPTLPEPTQLENPPEPTFELTQTELARAARRIALSLFVAQSLGSAGIIAAATVAAIIGAELSGRTALAGLPSSVTQLGVTSALLWSLVSERLGRRLGLSLGVLAGAFGAALALVAVLAGSFALLLAGLLVMASASASFNLGRFTAAEISPPARRGRAVALVVLGGTVGSVVGPTLVALSGRVALALGADPLVGPYGATAVLFILAALVLAFGLRPEPKRLALEVARRYPAPALASGSRPARILYREPAVLAALSAMILGYAVMIMLMGITALHMKQHDHGLEAIALAFSAHTFGMFAFSVLTGLLLDRWGRKPVIFAGTLILLAACLVAPLSLAFFPLAAALFLLGLGWNFCYVGGSTLLADALAPAERARTQGFGDLLIGLVSAGASVLSGLLLARYGYGAICLLGVLVSLVLLGVVLWYLGVTRRAPSSLPA